MRVQEVLPRAAGVVAIIDVHELYGPSLDDGVYGLYDEEKGDIAEEERGGSTPFFFLP